MKNFRKGFIIPLLIIIAVLIIGGSIYFWQKSKNTYQTLIAPNAQATSTDIVSISGMTQYTDSNFGFSFWYPSSWQVTQASVQNQNKYLGGTVVKQLNVTDGQRVITIEEFTSPIFSITDSTGVGACPVCVPTHYYFDVSQHTWMAEYPNGVPSGNIAPGVPVAANVSFNTMGGLHMLAGSQRFEANTIIPLSAKNFVIVTGDGVIATGSSDPQALTKTIVATDPSVATPVSQAQQRQTIQAEISAYANIAGTK